MPGVDGMAAIQIGVPSRRRGSFVELEDLKFWHDSHAALRSIRAEKQPGQNQHHESTMRSATGRQERYLLFDVPLSIGEVSQRLYVIDAD